MLDRLHRWVTEMSNPMFDSDPPPEDDERGHPYEKAGNVGSMPFRATYEWSHVVEQARRCHAVIERRGEVTDETLVEAVQLPATQKTYHPDQLDAETREAHRQRYFREHVRLVLLTAPDVDCRAGWDVDLAAAPDTKAEFREGAATLSIPGTDRTRDYPQVIEAFDERVRARAQDRDGRPVFTDEILTSTPFRRAIPDVDQAAVAEALEYAAELPWLAAPVNDAILPWTPETPGWRHRPAGEAGADATDGEGVNHAD